MASQQNAICIYSLKIAQGWLNTYKLILYHSVVRSLHCILKRCFIVRAKVYTYSFYISLDMSVDYCLISPDQQILWSLPNRQITLLYWKINLLILKRYFICWSSIRDIRSDGNSRKCTQRENYNCAMGETNNSQNSKTSHCDSGELKFTLTATSGNYILCLVNREI